MTPIESLSALSLAGLLLLPAYAWAQNDGSTEPASQDDAQVSGPLPDPLLEQVDRLDRQAQGLFDQGEYRRALDQQRAAQALLPATPRLFNMAVCEERLGHHEEAIELFQRFSEAADAPPERSAQARERIEQVRQQLEDSRLAEEREERERTEAALAAVAEARSPGTVGLSPTAFWTMIGLTAATAAAAVAFGVVTLVLHDEFLSTYRGEGDSDQLQERGQSFSLATNILLGFTALAALTTLVFGLDTNWRRRDRERRPLALRPALGGGSSALELLGRF